SRQRTRTEEPRRGEERLENHVVRFESFNGDAESLTGITGENGWGGQGQTVQRSCFGSGASAVLAHSAATLDCGRGTTAGSLLRSSRSQSWSADFVCTLGRSRPRPEASEL